MAYIDFTIEQAVEAFRLRTDTTRDLFAGVPPVGPDGRFQSLLTNNTPLALLMHTEKARSELLVAPVLAEVWRQAGRQLSVYSGTPLVVDVDAGLTGVCDFLIGRPPQFPTPGPPLLVVVEAKRDSIPDGLGQCAAGMVAALQLNTRANTGVQTVYGCVTTGSLWRFLRLTRTNLDIDTAEYQLLQLDRILGILLYMVGHHPQQTALAA